MNKEVLVSVLINNYNYGKFLPEAIDSVLAQTYKNYEIIIVDDGSMDNSREIIDSYYNKYPDLITRINKENGGQASAFNSGFAASKGEIIAFLDSDDYWFPDKLQKVVSAHKKYGIVQHDLLENGKKGFVCNLRNDIDFQKLFIGYGYIQSNAPTSGLSFKRDVLNKVFPVPVGEYKLCADLFVRSFALCFSKIYNIDEALGFYRIHGNNGYYGKLNGEEVVIEQKKTKEQLNKRFSELGLPLIPLEHSMEDIICGSIDIERDKIYLLYGTGKASENITRAIRSKGSKVEFYSDSNPDKWGKSFMDKPIIPPNEIKAKRKEFDKIIIASMYVNEILKGLKNLGLKEEQDILVPLIP